MEPRLDLGEALREWHDFYILVGTAAATLVGLMFVAASIGSGFYNVNHEAGLRAFVTPTVVHFAAILVACLLIVAPAQSWQSLGLLLFVEGVIGVAYTGRVILHMRRHGFTRSVDVTDRIWYALTPVAGYAIILASAVALALQARPSLLVLAIGLAVLLLAGIRNAWDMTLWIVMQPRKPD